eukprot:snap_masked-scaffold_8-processed-gene-5.27-mRNA-1 protein AED:1.00 eAED:1.00 QI:0/0/0/0/1/1/5/0/669
MKKTSAISSNSSSDDKNSNFKLNSLSTSSEGFNGAEELHDFVDDEKKRHSRQFYRPPEVRQFWGDDQDELETDWLELFYDLIYVAAAFQLGEQLEADVSKENFSNGLLFFCAQYSAMFTIWVSRTFYVSRFIVRSTYHKILDMFEAMTVAFCALFIGTSAEILQFNRFDEDNSDLNISSIRILADEKESEELVDFNFLAGFTLGLIILGIIYSARYLELVFVDLEEKEKEQLIKSLATRSVQRQLVIIIFGGTAFSCAATGFIEIGVSLLIAIPIFGSTVLFFLATKNKIYKPSIPIHVAFFIRRAGEFKMLMLGEGILQIIILTIDDSYVMQHFIIFALCFLVIALMQYLSYYVLPYEPKDHCYRKSKSRGAFLQVVQQAYFGSLIALGVGVKTVLKTASESKVESQSQYAFLLGSSLFAACFSLALQNILHAGLLEIMFCSVLRETFETEKTMKHFKEEWEKPGNVNVRRISAVTISLVFPVTFFFYPMFFSNDINPFTLLGVSVFLLVVEVFIFKIEKGKVFHDTDSEFNIENFSEEFNNVDEVEKKQTDFFSLNRSKVIEKFQSMRIGSKEELMGDKLQNYLEAKREKLSYMLKYSHHHLASLQETARSCSGADVDELLKELEHIQVINSMAIRSLTKMKPLLTSNEPAVNTEDVFVEKESKVSV